MRVWINPEVNLSNNFERQLRNLLHDWKVEGDAFIDYTFTNGDSSQRYQVDAVIILSNGLICCLEAKNYSGKWEGGLDEEWKCDGKVIHPQGSNPWKQVQKYQKALDILLRQLSNSPFNGIDSSKFVIHSVIVVPRNARVTGINHGNISNQKIETLADRPNISKIHQLIAKLEKVIPRSRQSIFLGKPTNLEKVVSYLKQNGNTDFILYSPIPAQTQQVHPVVKPQENQKISLELLNQPVIDNTPKQIKIENQQALPDLVNQPNSNSNLVDINDKHIELKKSRQPFNLRLLRIDIISTIRLIGFIAIASLLAWLGYRFYRYQSIPELDTTQLTIGTLSKPENYQPLANFLREEVKPKDTSFISYILGMSKIEIDSQAKYEDARREIKDRGWDIVFAYSPMLSIMATDFNYRYVARMFPDRPSYYQSVLFVRNDSDIYSLSDLKPTSVIALGDFNSASSFYMPTYDLAGKTLTVDFGNRGSEITRKVKDGVADVGAAAKINIENDPTMRVIHVSRDIPGSGVYLSPNLNQSDQEQLKRVLLAAPANIRDSENANYGPGAEVDYTEFRKIAARVEELLACRNFRVNPVMLYCRPGEVQTIANLISVSGVVQGLTFKDRDTIAIKISGNDQKFYELQTSKTILDQACGSGNLLSLNGKPVTFSGVIVKQTPEMTQVTINRGQLLSFCL